MKTRGQDIAYDAIHEGMAEHELAEAIDRAIREGVEAAKVKATEQTDQEPRIRELELFIENMYNTLKAGKIRDFDTNWRMANQILPPNLMYVRSQDAHEIAASYRKIHLSDILSAARELINLYWKRTPIPASVGQQDTGHFTPSPSASEDAKGGGIDYRALAEHYETLQSAEEWHEDNGPVLWWSLPVDEPPYCGTPLDEEWPVYHTHFTPLVRNSVIHKWNEEFEATKEPTHAE